MIKIGIILGSTRPGRNGEQVAKWVYDVASRRHDAEFELVDLLDYPLPHLDEPMSPSLGNYQNAGRQIKDSVEGRGSRAAGFGRKADTGRA
jgi:NAD(P)H-dependent FMN reductase